jgi:hypothetical protein
MAGVVFTHAVFKSLSQTLQSWEDVCGKGEQFSCVRADYPLPNVLMSQNVTVVLNPGSPEALYVVQQRAFRGAFTSVIGIALEADLVLGEVYGSTGKQSLLQGLGVRDVVLALTVRFRDRENLPSL